MTDVIYRPQDRHEPGPRKPGFSQRWADPERNRLELPSWPVEFGFEPLRQPKTVDVEALAKARGGDGHRGAAGFQCAELPFRRKPWLTQINAPSA